MLKRKIISLLMILGLLLPAGLWPQTTVTVQSQITIQIGTPPAPCTGITVNPGDNIQTLLSTTGNGGKTFCFSTGTYRIAAPLTFQANQKLVCASARNCVIKGSTIVTGWSSVGGGRWKTTQGFTTPHTTNFFGSFPDFLYAWSPYTDDLFSTNPGTVTNDPLNIAVPGMLEKVGVKDATGVHEEFTNSETTLGPGQYFVNYTDGTITIGDDPSTATLEKTVAQGMMCGQSSCGSGVGGVTIQGFTITQSGHYGIQAGPSWVITNNEVSFQASSGIRVDSGNNVSSNWTHHNGQYGMNGSGTAPTITGNELSYNNAHRYYCGSCGADANWASGGTKFVSSTSLVFQNNNSHNNYGDGFWHDIGGVDTWVQGNTFTNNARRGANFEISSYGHFLNNTINGGQNGIYINTSGNATNTGEIANNTITDTSDYAIYLVQGSRCSTNGFPVQNWNTHDNTIVQHVGGTGLGAGLEWQGSSCTSPYTANNTFTADHYTVNCAVTNQWRWSSGATSFTNWQGFGNDTTAGGGTKGCS